MNRKKSCKTAIFSCQGLGDGLVSLFLAHNLSINGRETTTFHIGKLGELQKWYPHLKISPFPKREDFPALLDEFDSVLVFYDPFSEYIWDLIEQGKKKKKMLVLSPTISKSEPPYYSDTLFKRELCMVENILLFCQRILQLPKTTTESGIVIPPTKNANRVIIHPTASKKGRMWSERKFIELALNLKEQNFSPVFITSFSERGEWTKIEELGLDLPLINDWDTLARIVSQGSFMIGNDSGIGHLASAFGIPTITLFRGKRIAKLWKPGWSKVISLYPSPLIPNLSKMRWRDNYWQKFISVNRVLRAFRNLCTLS